MFRGTNQPIAKRQWLLTSTVSCGLLLFLGAVTLSPPLHAEPDKQDSALEQRTRFLAAKNALKDGDAETFLQNAVTLQDYPLYPYLIYWHMRDNLADQSNVTIEAFLETHADTPLAPRLRTAWLRFLASEERWKDYLAFYKGSNSSELRCYAHYAEFQTGDKKAAWAGAKKLWLVGRSQNQACDPLFDAWEVAGGLDSDMRQQRIKLAIAHGNTRLASYLAKPLDEKERQWVTLWRKVDNNPDIIRNESALQKNNETNRRLVLHGLEILARRDPTIAADLWPTLSKRYTFSTKQRSEIERRVALNFATDGDARALRWFSKLPQHHLSASSAGWAVRTAMRQGNWQTALSWLGKVPKTESRTEQWQYWLARANEALGNKKKATELYESLSQERSYYGFLAADRIDGAYNLDHEPLEVSDEALDKLKQNPALIRARELYHLTLVRDARHEWDYAVARMNKEERLTAGKLADEWKWYDRALLTLAKAGHFDDLNIRFPLAYHEAVVREAEKRGLDPSWVYAVARQESAFIEDVRSSAGALGLMQLMPGTGKTIARELNTDFDNSLLLQADTNIRFGSYYLQQVLSRFDENPVLATAAYNAGPHRIEQWKPKKGHIDADIWVETMPFHETRQYVRRVMAYSVFYDQRLERPITRLKLRMPPVSTDEGVSECTDCPTSKNNQS